MLQVNQKWFMKPDLTRGLSISDDAKIISAGLNKIIESSRIIDATKHQVHNQDKNHASMETKLYDTKALCKTKTAEFAMYLSDDIRKRFFFAA